MEGPFTIIIPSPTKAVDNIALIKPFTQEVWTGVVLSLIVVVVSWQLIYLLSDFLSKTSGLSETNTRKETIFVPLAYTLTVILTQGNDTRWRGLGIRLIAGVWCLAASVLVPAYSGTLTSFLTTPIQRPIIESHLDIAGKISSAGIQVAVERGLGVDTQMQFWANLSASGTLNTSIVKMAFAARNSIFRCIKMEQCIEKVIGGGYIAIGGDAQAFKHIREDYAKSGECRITMAKRSFNKGFTTWAMPKNSPYFDLINKGILEVDAFGLSNYWKNYYMPRPTACLNLGTKPTQNKKITLVYMSSTFIVFLVGCGLSFAAFLLELVAKRPPFKRRV